MPYKDKQIQGFMSHAERNREWYERNRTDHIARAERNRRERKALIQQAKSKPCADCGIEYPYWVMDFDHVKGDKSFGLSEKGARVSRARLLEELDKCDVVCANCHRQRTHNRILVVDSSASAPNA